MVEQQTLMFYINAINGGGAERVILQLASHFAKAGYRAILVTSFVDENEYPVPGDVERISIEQKQIIQSRLKRNISRILALRELCKQYKPIAMISFMAEPNFRALCATRGLDVKNIISVRSDPRKEYGGKIGALVGKIFLPMADGCVFQTEEAREWFPVKLQKKSTVIFNEVNKVFFETQYKGGEKIVTLGRLVASKNHALLIEAFSDIAYKHQQINLEIYGSGNMKEKLRLLVKKLGLEKRVKLMGLTSKPEEVLSKAIMFVLASDYEGLPNALMEALAMGVPSISTDCLCGGPRALIRNNVNGLLVPCGDSKSLAVAMDRILYDKNLRDNFNGNAKKAAEDYYPDKVFSQWKQYLDKIVKQ